MKKEIKTKPVTILTILGDSSVGKTELCKIIVGLEFDPCVLATIGKDKMYGEMLMSD